MNGRSVMAIVLLMASVVGVDVYLYGRLADARSRLEAAQAQQEGMARMTGEYADLERRVRGLSSRRGADRARGVAQAVEEVVAPLGLRERLVSVKPLPPDKFGNERAELQLKQASMNETVNLLYYIGHAPAVLVMGEFRMSPAFEKPTSMDMTLTVTHVRER